MALTQISTQGIKDGTITGSDLATNVDLVNNQKLRLGTGNDLQIYHDGTNSFIVNNDGDLLIRNTTGNEIKIQAVSGEQSIQCIGDGAVELYFDGSKKFETTSGGAELPDGSVLTVQTTSTSNGFLSFLDIGNVGYEWKFPDNSTVQFGTNHGSDKRLQLNNEDASSHFHFSLADNGKMLFGNNDDLQIFHDGTSSILKNTTGGLFVQSDDTRITNAANSETIARFIADGAVELYYDSSKKFETTSLGATLTGRLISDGLDVGDSESLRLGNNYDLQIFHDGTSSLIKSSSHPIAHYSNTRHHFLNGDGSENMAVFVADGQCELYHNNSKKFQTESYGVQVFGNLFIADGGSGAGDNRIDIGNGSDFMIFHDGSTNIIDGRFHPIELRHQTEVHIKCVDDGAVELYHNNVKQMETTSGGASIRNHHKFDTGTVTQRSYLSSGNGINHRIMLAGAGTSNVQGQYIRAFANCANIDDSGTVKFVIFATGDCQNANNSFAGFSDVNLKQDITDAGSQWDDIKNLRVRKYRFKNNPTGPLQIGCIAQEAETVSPGLIDTDPEEGFKSLKYSVLYMKGIKCLQEAMARIEALETEVAALKAA